jgi:hypothetical protein
VEWAEGLRLRRTRMPCSLCNVPDDGGAPRMPDGFEIKINKDGGWLH